MRPYVVGIVAVLTAAAATAIWLVVIHLSRPSIQAAWIDGLYQRKIAAAERLAGNRFVIIGGSGAHYGFSGKEVSALTGHPTVNLGTHAGLGLPYILDRAKRVLRPGDFAVLIIEPHLYFVSKKPSSVLSEYVLRYDLKYLLRTSPSDALSLMFGVSPAELIQEQARRSLPWLSKLGRAETVDGTGDETLILSEMQTPQMTEELRKSHPMPPWTAPRVTPKVLAEFFEWAKENKIAYGIAWTPMLQNSIYSTESYQRFFADLTHWYVSSGGLDLGPATDYFQPLENMFDYIYHDNEKGRSAASKSLARSICKAVVCTTPHRL